MRISIFLFLTLLSSALYAHGGGTDSYGCHNQTSTGTYHCHNGGYDGQSFSSKDAFLAHINSTPSNSNPTVTIPAGSRTINDSDSKAGESITISATATDSDGSISSTAWIVDGTTLATGTVAILSLTDGAHTVTFQATDNNGASSSTSITVTIVAPSSISTAYNRDDYLPDWADANGDCISTRHEVLIIESLTAVTMSSNGCTVLSGMWLDPLTGLTFTNPSDVDIDHHVPLAEAHDSGASLWPIAQKQAFANDMLMSEVLIAVDDATNSSKGARDPAEWLPPNSDYHCEYVRNWVEVKTAYNLSYDEAERAAIENILGTEVSMGARSSITGTSTLTGTTSARFGMGLRRKAQCGYSATATTNEELEISFSIVPELSKLGGSLDIILVAAVGSDMFSISSTGQLVPFTGDPGQLVPFIDAVTLKESYTFTLFDGSFSDSVNVDIFVVY